MLLRGAHDRYTLFDVLDHETQLSEVWGAVSLRRGPVIVKRARPEVPQGVMQFALEAELTLGCTSPEVVAAIERIEGQEGPWLVLERIAGPDLGALARVAPLDPLVIAWAVHEVARLIGGLHREGLVHRDVKMENVVWDTANGGLKLIDLGLSSPIGERPRNDAMTLLATAPEALLKGSVAEPRHDIYSLGVMARLLFHKREPPAWMADLIARMTAPEPADRPASMDEVMDAILAHDVPPPTTPTWANPNPFPLTSSRCPRCRTMPPDRFTQVCSVCGSEYVVVLLLVVSARDGTAPALLRLDVAGPAADAVRRAFGSPSPVLAVHIGSRINFEGGSGVVFVHPCFGEWRTPVVTGE